MDVSVGAAVGEGVNVGDAVGVMVSTRVVLSVSVGVDVGLGLPVQAMSVAVSRNDPMIAMQMCRISMAVSQ